MKRRHPADEAADQQMIEAIRHADHFLASLFRGAGHYQKATARTVLGARAEAAKMEAASERTMRSLIYAVSKDGRATMLTPALIDRLLAMALTGRQQSPRHPTSLA